MFSILFIAKTLTYFGLFIRGFQVVTIEHCTKFRFTLNKIYHPQKLFVQRSKA